MVVHMSQTQQKKDWNSTFIEKGKWKTSEEKENYLVLSFVTDNDTGKKSFLLNKQWKTQDGKTAYGKGAMIPVEIVSEVIDALKIANAEVSG